MHERKEITHKTTQLKQTLDLISRINTSFNLKPVHENVIIKKKLLAEPPHQTPADYPTERTVGEGASPLERASPSPSSSSQAYL